LRGAGEGALEVLAYGPNRVRIAARTTEPALLILSDIHYPGWHARLDGRPTPLYKANGIFRGVVVPPGEHIIEMDFFPPSLRLGLGMAALAICVIIATLDKLRWRG